MNGVGGYTLRATVTDNGEPGVNRDTFGPELWDGVLNPAVSFVPMVIIAGNLQTH